MDLACALVGALVGFLVGLTGVGGGSLMAPLLILLFGYQPAVAVGTDLWFAALTKTVGGFVHHRVNSPEWQIIRRLAAGSVPAAILTLLWLGIFHGGRLEAGVLLKLLGGALILSALVMPMKGKFRAPLVRLRQRIGPSLRGHQLIATVGGGMVVGSLVTLTSVGAGALIAVLLMLIYPLRLDVKRLVSTDIVHAIPLALVAAIGHSWLGNVDWLLLMNLLVGSVPGIIVGSLMVSRINENFARVLLGIILAFAGYKLLTR